MYTMNGHDVCRNISLFVNREPSSSLFAKVHVSIGDVPTYTKAYNTKNIARIATALKDNQTWRVCNNKLLWRGIPGIISPKKKQYSTRAFPSLNITCHELTIPDVLLQAIRYLFYYTEKKSICQSCISNRRIL